MSNEYIGQHRVEETPENKPENGKQMTESDPKNLDEVPAESAYDDAEAEGNDEDDEYDDFEDDDEDDEDDDEDEDEEVV